MQSCSFARIISPIGDRLFLSSANPAFSGMIVSREQHPWTRCGYEAAAPAAHCSQHRYKLQAIDAAVTEPRHVDLWPISAAVRDIDRGRSAVRLG